MINNPASSDLLEDSVSSLRALSCYVSRLELWPQILLRQQEDLIINLVDLPSDFIEQSKSDFLGNKELNDVLTEHRWTESDLLSYVSRSESLRLFSEQLYGPGLEELFLSANGGHDQVIYSVLRVRDFALVQELWIRLEEREATFAELASQFGEGPEAARKGLYGPIAIGSILPSELGLLLRSLKVGEVNPPTTIGDWHVLIRLEQLTPSRLDSGMRDFLLNQQLNSFLENRVQRLLQGLTLDPLEFDNFL